MKKILVVVSVALVALVIFGAGFAFSQTSVVSASGLPAGYGPGGMGGGRGGMMGGVQVHEYVEQAFADKLGLTKAEIETAFSSGKSMYQIAIDKGIKETDVTALLTEVHKTAFAKAVSDGVLTQAQADTMLQNMTANGFNFANGSMHNGGGPGQGMHGGRGQGGMMGGWNQPQATTTP
jgi:Spy/CpxP family protein refolding chaperone